jgi:hypothetical protein
MLSLSQRRGNMPVQTGQMLGTTTMESSSGIPEAEEWVKTMPKRI